MRKKLLSILALLLMTAATGAWAQEQWDVVWDFTAWSTETVTALKADAAASNLEGWSDIEKEAAAVPGAVPDAATKDNCFWSCSGTVNADGNLSANGVVIKELKGLKFNSDYAAQRKLAIAVNYPSTSLGDYAGGAYLWLGGGGNKQTCPCFTIPGVKAGSKITIEVESNKPSDGRGIGLYKNSYAAENLIGEQFKPTAKEAKTWEIAEDCDVVVWNTKDCHIYTIKVKAPAAAASGYTVSLNDGTENPTTWTASTDGTNFGALPIGGLKGDGSETVTLKYNGRLKVKGVKATSDAAPAKPAATVTTAPTGAAIVGVGKTTALVSGGVADGGTLWYAVTTTNTMPTSTAGFSDAVPTAQTLAAGTYYVWYYAKGDADHSDSEIAGPVSVTVAPATITVTWNNDDITGSGNSFTKDGVTITAGSIDFDDKSFEENGTFTTTLGYFTKIEVVATNGLCDVSNTGGWWGNSEKRTWTGNASSVSFIGDIYGDGNGIKFVFTIEP